MDSWKRNEMIWLILTLFIAFYKTWNNQNSPETHQDYVILVYCCSAPVATGRFMFYHLHSLIPFLLRRLAWFYGLILLYFDNTNQIMQNTTQKFRQSFCLWETTYFFWNFDELQLSYSSIFFAEISHTFSTYHCLQKGCKSFFILFRSWVTCKN